MIEKIELIRAEIAALCEELAWTRDARLPLEDAAARIPEVVAAIAARYNADVIGAQLADLRDPAGLILRWLTAKDNLELGPLLSWLFRDQITQRLGEVLGQADYVPGLPLEERPQRLAELAAQLRELEIQEESLVEAAESAGLEVFRRANVNWGIVLGYDPDGSGDALSIPARVAIQPAHPAPAGDQAPAQGDFLGGAVL